MEYLFLCVNDLYSFYVLYLSKKYVPVMIFHRIVDFFSLKLNFFTFWKAEG